MHIISQKVDMITIYQETVKIHFYLEKMLINNLLHILRVQGCDVSGRTPA
jgi:hypothetical protein